MTEAVEIGTVSARGQIAIPSEIREKMHFKTGEKVLFLVEGNDLILKKASDISWDSITLPLRKMTKKIKEGDVVALVHKVRKK
ncbi:AbrB/MazE/SpoVT family DNA-binding domain-containing protein [Candidatus Woesearchaeota archaeon]|nr:AbrB/MazE/SpoVT family DNA-binding domain-containing protein [Candidatus Woesearchaeota archaeon]